MDTEGKRKGLLEKIEKIESQITLLNDLKSKLISQLNAPHKESPSSTCLTAFQNSLGRQNVLEFSITDKINLFRSLFRGRDDVYARFWVSKKTGKSGYSPVCKNEWVSKICQKPIMKCSKCPNRELVPLDDEIIRKHLVGAHVVGIYPILTNETCYFLAVDFDKEDWIDNAFTFRETCVQEGAVRGTFLFFCFFEKTSVPNLSPI